MIDAVIRRLTAANQADLDRCDSSFAVEAELCLHAGGGDISYTLEPVPPYHKRYPPEERDLPAWVSRSDHAGWLAYVDGRVAGQLLVKEHWNRFAIIWDIAVDPPFRRQGVGRQLMEQAIAWARQRGLPGVMLETQNINVPACRLYESCGFRLSGFDVCLYRGIEPHTRDIALYWYLLFSAEAPT